MRRWSKARLMKIKMSNYPRVVTHESGSHGIPTQDHHHQQQQQYIQQQQQIIQRDQSTKTLSIGLWNANGLSATTINDVLRHCSSIDIFLITETWLLAPKRIYTSWQQFHLYGQQVEGGYRGSQGVSALISPSCPFPVSTFPLKTKYALGLQIGRSLRIICLYLPPLLDPETINTTLSALPLTHKTIICGDFNARMGKFTGDTDTNPRGNLLKNWCNFHQLDNLNSIHAYGTPTFITARSGYEISSIVDYFLTNSNDLIQPTMHVATELSLGSDHKLMTLSFGYRPANAANNSESTHSSSSPRRMWNLSRLQEPEVRDLYCDTFTSLSAPLLQDLSSIQSAAPTTQPPIDDLNGRLNDIVYKALDTAVGSRQARPK